MKFLLIGALFTLGCSVTHGGTGAIPTQPTTIVQQAAPPVASPVVPQTACATNPPYGGNDITPPVGGCFGPGRSYAEIVAAIAAHPQDTWGLSGRGFAYPQQLPDGTWIIAVAR